MSSLPLLLPRPRHVRLLGETTRLACEPDDAPARIDFERIPHPQGYQLTIDDAVSIVAHGEAGLFYARQTLKQLYDPQSGMLPRAHISDWPDFPRRGVMLDISRDKVPTMHTLYRLVDTLASWKINELQLYTEHTFAYTGHERVWQHAAPMTPEQIHALEQYCRERFIDLVPNQNSFGHMERWLRHEPYHHLSELPPGSTLGHRPPTTLCPTEPATLRLIDDLYSQLLPHFRSERFNVGCDETWDLGQGRSRQACEARGTGRVYLDYLKALQRRVREHGRTMMFWGDIILQYPEQIEQLPDGIIALDWGYEADHPFEDETARFAAADVPFYVCPGTSSWNSFAGRTDNMLTNIHAAATHGLKHSADGLLITDWGDNGHLQPLPVSYPGFAAGAAMSWCLQANAQLDWAKVLDRFAFADQAGQLGQAALDLGNAYQRVGLEIPNASVLHHIMVCPAPDRTPELLESMTAESLRQTLHFINDAQTRIAQARSLLEDADLVQRELQHAAALMKHAATLGLALLNAHVTRPSELPASVREELAPDLFTLINEHRSLWLVRNRRGGLDDSTAWLNRLLEAYTGQSANIALG